MLSMRLFPQRLLSHGLSLDPTYLFTVVTMLVRTLLAIALAISVPAGRLWARVQDVGPQYPEAGFNQGDFRFGTGARNSLQSIWRASDAVKQERVACIGGYQHGGITYITRVEVLTASDGDSLNAPARASLQECRPPEWLGTVHTHVARFDGIPYVTFSGADRGVMRQWHSMWREAGVFCVVYDDRRAHCEAGDERSGDAVYAHERGNNLAQ